VPLHLIAQSSLDAGIIDQATPAGTNAELEEGGIFVRRELRQGDSSTIERQIHGSPGRGIEAEAMIGTNIVADLDSVALEASTQDFQSGQRRNGQHDNQEQQQHSGRRHSAALGERHASMTMLILGTTINTP
jgi:hypothetical protein